MLSFGDLENHPTITILIHGGAWRTGSPKEYEDVGLVIASILGNCLIPKYTLCMNGIKWGVQMNDLINFLHSLYFEYKKPIQLIGHSCGGQMSFCLLAIQKGLELLDFNGQIIKYKEFGKINHVFSVEGIYDINDMLDEYPEYINFVSQCFGEDPRMYAVASPSSFSEYFKNEKITVIQSVDDGLLSARQSEQFAKMLGTTVNWIRGRHWECLRLKEFQDILRNQ